MCILVLSSSHSCIKCYIYSLTHSRRINSDKDKEGYDPFHCSIKYNLELTGFECLLEKLSIKERNRRVPSTVDKKGRRYRILRYQSYRR